MAVQMGASCFGDGNPLLAIHVALNGWPLFFTHPEIEDIQCVTATNSSTGETVQVDASTGDMEFEFTANLLGCLSYKPFPGEGSPPTRWNIP